MKPELTYTRSTWAFTFADKDILRKSPSSYKRFFIIGLFNFQLSMMGGIATFFTSKFYGVKDWRAVISAILLLIIILSCISLFPKFRSLSLKVFRKSTFATKRDKFLRLGIYFYPTLFLAVILASILSFTLWISIFGEITLGKNQGSQVGPFVLFFSGALFIEKTYLLILFAVSLNLSIPIILSLVLTGSYEKLLEIKINQEYLDRKDQDIEGSELKGSDLEEFNKKTLPKITAAINTGFYISYVKLLNIRCFSQLELNFDKVDNPTLWTVFLGDNSTGKSTLLRSLAIGICDQSSATALIKKSGSFLKHGESNGEVKITLKDYATKEEYTITTEIVKERNSQHEKIKQHINTKDGDFPWDKIFACGYGTQRYLIGKDVSGYEIYDALTPLFDNSVRLQKPETILLREKHGKNKEIDIEKKLLNILMTNTKDFNIQFTNDGIKVNDIELRLVSDGYKSTIIWVMDLISWLINAERISGDTISGIVFIDELEQHLHPKWQKSIVKLLKAQFPGVQFFATTHSPLIASSMGSLDPKLNTDKLIHLKKSIDGFIKYKELDSLKGLDVDQLLAHEAFDFQMNEDPEIEEVLLKSSMLASKGNERNQKEEEEYSKLKEQIKQINLSDRKTKVQRDVEKEEYDNIKQQIKNLEKGLENDTNY